MDRIDIIIGIKPPTLRGAMLAPTRIPHPWQVRWPVLASEKIDGVRNLMFPGFGCRSRSGCAWFAEALRDRLARAQAVADANKLVLDGELWAPGMSPRDIQARLARLSGPAGEEDRLDDLRFLVFDAIDYREHEGEAATPFEVRHARACRLLEGIEHVTVLEQRPIADWRELCLLYRRVRAAGGEGLMIRRADGLHRHGRCSMLERAIFKIKPIHANSRQMDIPCGLEV